MSAIVDETLLFGQHEGGDVQLLVNGDEFYARYETTTGYTALYDIEGGCYCYAELENGAFVSTRVPISKKPPRDLKRHVREAKGIRNNKFNDRYTTLHPVEPAEPGRERTLGPNGGLLYGRRFESGAVHGLTILVEFDDITIDDQWRLSVRDDVDAMLNDENYSANGNFCSVNKYYKLMSGQRLDYTNHVVGPVTLSGRRSYYIDNLLVREALELAIDEFDIDLADYDSRGEGVVDALSFFYAGRTQYSGDLWPHNSVVNLQQGSVRTHFYTIQSIGERRSYLSFGTAAHEAGHMICRFPDLYDYGVRDGDFQDSSGLGRYCLMSSGNHLNYGRTPAPICAYLRDLVNWCEVEDLNKGGRFKVKHGAYDKAHRYSLEGKPHEYFLVENRSKRDGTLDEYLPGQGQKGGLAVYHCDTRGSNEYQDGTPDRHYQCALLQADGHEDLERNRNVGDKGDFFGKKSGNALSDDTNPDSLEWGGSDSGLIISDVEEPGRNVRFTVGESQHTRHVVKKSVVEHKPIPDNNPDGITSEIFVPESGAIKKVKVTGHISHTYRGDLWVGLSHEGDSVDVFHGNGPLDDVHLDYTDKEAFNGHDVHGVWTLRVVDRLRDDTGHLQEWGLEITLDDRQRTVRKEIEPAREIPDRSEEGVTSTLYFDDPGVVTAVEVEVDVTHTYRGDLAIDLIAPTGEEVKLVVSDHRQPGHNLQGRFDLTNTPELSEVLGLKTSGDWRLRVADRLWDDVGTFERWALTLTSESSTQTNDAA